MGTRKCSGLRRIASKLFGYCASLPRREAPDIERRNATSAEHLQPAAGSKAGSSSTTAPREYCEDIFGNLPDCLLLEAEKPESTAFVEKSASWMSGYLEDSASIKLTLPVPSAFHARYQPIKLLGRGTFSRVVLAVPRGRYDDNGDDVRAFASKEMPLCPPGYEPGKGESTRQEVEQEVEMLRNARHPSIVQLVDVVWEEDRCYLLTQVLKGGDLLDALHIRGSLAEDDARAVMTSVFQALKYLHASGVAHRDVKLENIMLEHFDDFRSIKLVDFGLALKMGDGCLAKPAGSPLFTAPEVLTVVDGDTRLPRYGTPCDIWSAGVVLYTLLGGAPPFLAQTTLQDMFNDIRLGRYNFRDPAWEMVSVEAKDLITRLMCLSPDTRLTAAEALDHPWMQD
eukprot:jgi/Tetstr1/440204/TSEL_028556.t1